MYPGISSLLVVENDIIAQVRNVCEHDFGFIIGGDGVGVFERDSLDSGYFSPALYEFHVVLEHLHNLSESILVVLFFKAVRTLNAEPEKWGSSFFQDFEDFCDDVGILPSFKTLAEFANLNRPFQILLKSRIGSPYFFDFFQPPHDAIKNFGHLILQVDFLVAGLALPILADRLFVFGPAVGMKISALTGKLSSAGLGTHSLDIGHVGRLDDFDSVRFQFPSPFLTK